MYLMIFTSTFRVSILLMLWLLTGPVLAQKLAAGMNFSLAIHPNGTLWGWGFNDNGQTGTGQASTYPTVATQIGTGTWQVISANYLNAAGIRTDGTLWTWGSGSYKQLGDGSAATRFTPSQLGTATWQSVSLGVSYTLAVRQDGTLWAWGSNNFGQLGDGTTIDRLTPVQIGTATNWRTVYASTNSSFALRQDGTLWAWGYNTLGQLGLGSTTSVTQPMQVGTANWQSVAPAGTLGGDNAIIAVRQDGTLWGWGQSSNLLSLTTVQTSPIQLSSATTWKTVAQGKLFAFALRQDGTLWAWGDNRYGQLGTGAASASGPNSPVQVGTGSTWQGIAAGETHALAQQNNGTIWAWGSNGYGELGNGQGLRLSPAQVGTATTWDQIAATYYTTWGIQRDGSLWGWGENSWGLAGYAAPLDQADPGRINAGSTWQSVGEGYLRNAAVRQDGTLWRWGILPNGTVVSPPQQLGNTSTWRSTASGYGFSLAIQQDGTLWAWGINNFGQLGTGGPVTDSPATPVQVGTATTWRSISCGDSHAAGIRTDGTLWAWGLNSNGQVGRGSATTNSYNTPMQIGTATTWSQVACGFLYTVALRSDGTLWAWGTNDFGQLGTGTTTQLNQPTQIGLGSTWQWIEAGRDGTAAIRQDGTLWVWGRNNLGQLGQGTVLPQSLPSPTQVGTSTNWRRVAVGSGHMVALRTDGTLWSWGLNDHGQLGNQPALRAIPQYVANAGTPLSTVISQPAPACTVAPNPAHNQIQVLGLSSSLVTVQLLDPLGRLVCTANNPRLSIQGVSPGLYILRVSGPELAPRSIRLVVE
jgi:alpha-tubulin suppressor-like RCC1 family protein